MLEVKTYRYRGHSMSDPASIARARRSSRCAPSMIASRARGAKLMALDVDEASLKAIDDEVKKIVQDAAEFAKHSPSPIPRSSDTDVLVEA